MSGPMPELRQQLAEVLAPGDVAADPVGQLARPVPGDGARAGGSARRRSCRRRPRRSGRSGRRDGPAPTRCRRARSPWRRCGGSCRFPPWLDWDAWCSITWAGSRLPGCQPPDVGRSRRLNSASRSVHDAAARPAWRTIQGSTRLESSMVRVGAERAVLDDDPGAVPVVGHPVGLQLERDVGDDRHAETTSRDRSRSRRSTMSASRIGTPALEPREQVDDAHGRERVAGLGDRSAA